MLPTDISQLMMVLTKSWEGSHPREGGRTRTVPRYTGHLQLCWFSQAEDHVLKIPAIEQTSSEAHML